MAVRQISLFLENSKGTLYRAVKELGDAGINILAMTVADTTDFGIVRMIVKSEDTEKATALLTSKGDVARASSVVCVKIPHRPAGLAYALSILEDAGVSVEYSYSFCRNNGTDAAIILRTSDDEKCTEALTAAGIEILSEKEINSFE